MNPTSGSDILSYAGNVGLGLNSDAGALGAYGETDLTAANSAVFNLAYLNMQKNKVVYEQKIKDRDDGMKLIAEGQLQVNNALPKDREKLMALIDETKKTYFENGGDVKSDPRVWLKINDQLSKFNTANATASSRYLMATNGIAEAAKETNPYKKDKMLQHWNNQMGRDIYEPMDPYQNTLDWDNSKVFRKMTETTKEVGTDGYNRVYETKTNLPESYRDFVNAYQQGDKEQLGLNVDTFLNSFYGKDGILTPDAVQSKAQEVNNRLKKIATAEGYNPEDLTTLPEYLKPLNPKVVNGAIESNDYKWNDWYKIMLYDQYNSKKDTKFDKNLLDVKKVDDDRSHDKALEKIGMLKAGAYADAQRSIAGKNKAATKALNEQTTPAQNYDELKTKTATVKTEKGGYVTRVNWDDLSNNTRQFLGVDYLSAKDGKERFINIAPTQVVIQQNGKDQLINDNDVDKYYRQARDKGYEGSMVDYLNSVGAKYDIEVVGREKGKTAVQRANRLGSYQNQQKGKTKTSLFLEDDNTPDEVDE